MATQMTKSQLIEKIAEDTELGKKDVKSVIESMVAVGHKELKKAGVFLVPGFAKFVVIKKPATKARKGINPFTKEKTMFKAKPERKAIKARPAKASKTQSNFPCQLQRKGPASTGSLCIQMIAMKMRILIIN